MSARYAIYFAPDRHSPWRTFGAGWLGRDEHDSAVLEQPQLAGISRQELDHFTAEPRRYGFHATLKAPFRLAPGYAEPALVSRLAALAASLQPLSLGPMCVTSIGSFVALVPEHPPAALQQLAARCVSELDALRAAPIDAEIARRRPTELDRREAELLALYGYPHVMERFRLHLTLTGPLEPSDAHRVREAVAPKVAELNAAAPLWLDRLCLFVQAAPQAPFHRIIDLRLPA